MTEHAAGVSPEVTGWRASLPAGLRPYTEAAPLAALFLGMSSGFPFAMIAATLSTRLAQSGIEKSTVTAFALTFLAYNFKWLWAPIIDAVKLPLLGRIGQRVSWLILCAVLVMVSIIYLGSLDPEADIASVAVAAILVGIAGATFDIVIDAYRIELLEPHQLGVGSGMSQYGWRIGAAAAGSLALVIAARAGLDHRLYRRVVLRAVRGDHRAGDGRAGAAAGAQPLKGPVAAAIAYVSPLAEFFKRSGALIVLLFVLVHKIGDTLANLTLRLLFEDLGFTNDEIAIYDVGLGFWALLVGHLRRRLPVRAAGHEAIGADQPGPDGGIEPHLRGARGCRAQQLGDGRRDRLRELRQRHRRGVRGRVPVGAVQPEFTATQFALLSAAASITGRFLTGTLAGGMIEQLGYANFYLVTTLAALPGVLLFWWMMASGLVDRSLGTAGTEESGG